MANRVMPRKYLLIALCALCLCNQPDAKSWSLQQLFERQNRNEESKKDFCEGKLREISMDGYGLFLIKKERLYKYAYIQADDGTPCVIHSIGRIGRKFSEGGYIFQFLLEDGKLCRYRKQSGDSIYNRIEKECYSKNGYN